MTRVKRAILFALVLLLFSGCGTPALTPAADTALATATPAAEAPEDVTFELAAPEKTAAPAPTAPPTPEPTASPVPTPEPKITADWYRARSENIARLLVENEFCKSVDEANARVQKMEIDPDKPMVALTFDDGPTHGVTDTVLDVLEKYNARATFFVVGSRIAGSEDLLKRAVSLGCEIGSHTFNHDTLTELSTERAVKSLTDTRDAVRAACGYEVLSLRPPKGESNDNVKAIARQENYALIFWNHSTHDYRLDSAKKIASYVQFDKEDNKAIADGDIILLHDLRKPTAEAMEEIVKQLTDEGYQLVTVQELLNLSDGGFSTGKSYKKQ